MAMEASTGVKSHRQIRLTMPPNKGGYDADL